MTMSGNRWGNFWQGGQNHITQDLPKLAALGCPQAKYLLI